MADMPIALYRLPVSKGAKLVLSYLWRYAGREPFVWVDRETVASDLGIDNDRTMRRLLGELRKAGAIEEDEQVRQGRVRRGWWLWDGRDVGEDDVGREASEERDGDGASVHGGALEQDDDCQTLEVDEESGHEDASSSSADRNGRGRTKMAARAVKNDRGRTEMTAAAAKNDRATSLEPPMNQSSLSDRAGASRAPPAEVDEGERVRAELKLLRRWRVHGGDPEGLGAWPTPTTPGGVELPRLSMGGKLAERLQEEQTAEEIHRAVHLVAELVEAGELAADKWRATYVFSGWLDELVVKAVALRGKRTLRRAARGHGPKKTETKGLSVTAIRRAFAESEVLRSMAQLAGVAPLPKNSGKS